MYLPLDVANLSQTAHMELIELPYVAPAERPSFAAIEECCQYHSSINSYLCFKGDAVVAPETFLQSAEGNTSLPESCTDVVIDVCVIGQ